MTQEPRSERGPPDASAEGRGSDVPDEHPPATLNSLKQAMRRARFDDAEHVGVMSDLRAARIGRLELLEEALQPLAEQIPEEVDLFDFGLASGANPRLFLDMIGFVEMGRDARTYRLLQDTRHGRKLIAESDRVARMVECVTDYVARRLIERDKALAAADEGLVGRPDAPERTMRRRPARGRSVAPPTEAPSRRGPALIAGVAFGFLIDMLGSIALTTIVLALLFYVATLVWPHLLG